MKFRAALLLLAFIVPAIADEGTWLFDHFPTATVKTKYNFDVTPAFLENLRLASVRVGDGTGAFVSPTGLIITNQHLIAACLAQSAGGKDYAANGFQAANQAEELRCPS